MNSIQTSFSIKDLENISGVKAHTLRIWEKRYQLLEPSRTETNIRYYTQDNLEKLLNITLLNNNGYKISKISKLTDKEIVIACKDLVFEQSESNSFIIDLKIAMFNFDKDLFEKTYLALSVKNNFRQIFVSYFIPFLNEIGKLWHIETINPSHEHFITSLIKQKILLNTEQLEKNKIRNTNQNYVLFLPENEIHELGLLYLNYELIKNGCSTIFLGQSMPIKHLQSVLKDSIKTIFISYFTIHPKVEKISSYLDSFQKTILKNSNHQLFIFGRKINNEHFSNSNIKNLKVEDFISTIES